MQAKASAKNVAKRLMNKGKEKVSQYYDQIKKGIKHKTFVRLSDEEVAGLSPPSLHLPLGCLFCNFGLK